MTKTPLVSIIIPTFNRAHLIGETLDSVLAQTYTNWECIVVDDGSTDNTAEVLKNYCVSDARFKYHHRPSNRPKGANACRNYGFELGKGEYINWFDDDDIMRNDKLDIQLQSLQHGNYNFSVCQTLVFEDSIENIIGLRHAHIVSGNPFRDYVMLNIVWMTPSSLWLKSFLLDNHFLFDETLKAAQEWEFHSRILYEFNDYAVTNIPLVYIRKHSDSVSYNNKVGVRVYNYYKARTKIYDLIKHSENNILLKEYLLLYFLGIFKKVLVASQFRLASKIYFKYVLRNSGLKVFYRFKLFIAIITFVIIGKGYFFIREDK